MNLLIAPHNDDESLFTAFTCLRDKPYVVVALRSVVQGRLFGLTAEEREAETAAAMKVLGCEWEQWPELDDYPEWGWTRTRVRDCAKKYEQVYAPAPEPNGNAQHNMIGQIAKEEFGMARFTGYTTYRVGGVRSVGTEVEFEPEWLWLKLEALSCYRSQARTPSFIHFTESLREYVA